MRKDWGHALLRFKILSTHATTYPSAVPYSDRLYNKTEWKKRDLFCQTTAEIEEVHLQYCCFVSTWHPSLKLYTSSSPENLHLKCPFWIKTQSKGGITKSRSNHLNIWNTYFNVFLFSRLPPKETHTIATKRLWADGSRCPQKGILVMQIWHTVWPPQPLDLWVKCCTALTPSGSPLLVRFWRTMGPLFWKVKMHIGEMSRERSKHIMSINNV